MLAKFAHGTTSIRTFEILPPGHRKTEKRIASRRDRPSNIQHQRMSVSALPATNIIKGLAQSSLVGPFTWCARHGHRLGGGGPGSGRQGCKSKKKLSCSGHATN